MRCIGRIAGRWAMRPPHAPGATWPIRVDACRADGTGSLDTRAVQPAWIVPAEGNPAAAAGGRQSVGREVRGRC